MTVWREGTPWVEPPFKNGDVVESGNFIQLRPNTEICKDVTDLTINGGLFTNCKPQASWTINGGNWCQQEFCSHARPDLLAFGLVECGDDCGHRSEAKVEREVDEDEFRRKRKELAARDLAIDETVDADGVSRQVFKVTEFEYNNKLISTGSRVRKRLLSVVRPAAPSLPRYE